MKKINILGSTGIIGKKSLNVIDKHFNKFKINFILANNNYLTLSKQANLYNPNYVGIINTNYYKKLKELVSNKNIKIICGNDCFKILNNKVDSTIISISGISSLKYIQPVIKGSKNIGIVNKESIVSAGKFINKLIKKYKVRMVPLDSEHYSIYTFLQNNFDKSKINKIYLTASGGPFLNHKNIFNKKISVKDALKHPTWKMGVKNTIDSATMINKCLEIIEAHYLFNLKYSKLDIIIHPESIVHSVIKTTEGSFMANISNNDMSIPIYGFLNNDINQINKYNKLELDKIKRINFLKPDKNKFPALKIFDNLNKESLSEIIIFNISNQIAVDLFIKNKIKFADIVHFIKKSLNKFENFNLCNINDVIMYQDYIYSEINNKLNKI